MAAGALLTVSRAGSESVSVVSGEMTSPASHALTVSRAGSESVSVVSGEMTSPASHAQTVSRAGSESVTVVSGEMTFPTSYVVSAGSLLRFDPAVNTTLEVAGNLVVMGMLEMKPDPGVTHTLRFLGVEEALFVGGGMEVLESDRGLWVMGQGRLDLVGADKTGWNRTGSDPSWQASDELLIAPSAPNDYGQDGFNAYVLGSAVPQISPAVPPTEVLNLTRSVRIEGTPTGRSHVTIMSESPQTIRFVALRYMGPRPMIDGVPTSVMGRYPIHFHFAGEGSRGSIVEGSVVRDSGNRAFVNHASHGVTFRGNVAYNVIGVPFWWDQGEENASHDSVWEGNLAGLIHAGDEDEFTNAGFFLGLGDGNVANSNVAVGVQGKKNCSGFNWPSQGSGIWEFEANVAHNNECHGIFVWQNSSRNHFINDFIAYRNAAFGVNHGAYKNNYIYTDLYLLENGAGGVNDHAFAQRGRSDFLPQSWSCVTVEGSPVALTISVSNAADPGGPADFAHLVSLNTPAQTVVSEAALNKGQTLDSRAQLVDANLSCGTFIDDNGSAHETMIEAIAARGITGGCNPPAGNRFC
ncbi:MAG: manganese catalase family protein, partial [Actinobacteria bacterium]|nr:manganese catalase family protein [Actinomycetota bacterium]